MKSNNKIIQSRIENNKQNIFEKLKQVPIVQVACQKIGIGRATYYRWRKKDKQFAQKADKAIQEGRLFINDMAESQLISAIKEQNMTAIIWWLRNNHPGYADRVELTHKTEKEELSPKQRKLVQKAIALTHSNKLGE